MAAIVVSTTGCIFMPLAQLPAARLFRLGLMHMHVTSDEQQQACMKPEFKGFGVSLA